MKNEGPRTVRLGINAEQPGALALEFGDSLVCVLCPCLVIKGSCKITDRSLEISASNINNTHPFSFLLSSAPARGAALCLNLVLDLLDPFQAVLFPSKVPADDDLVLPDRDDVDIHIEVLVKVEEPVLQGPGLGPVL